jgi:hypothetical protein
MALTFTHHPRHDVVVLDRRTLAEQCRHVSKPIETAKFAAYRCSQVGIRG